MTPREAAVLSLNSAFKKGRFINIELDSAIKKYGFEDKDKSFFTRLLYGTVERKITLDYYLSRVSDIELSKIAPLVLCILETGLYQIFYMDRVPDSAACNESTELVKRLCPKAYAGFVNAVLRNAVRKKDGLINELENIEGIKGISIREGIPEWICELWQRDYGNAEDIAYGFGRIPPHITLHVNTLKTTADKLAALFDQSFGARKVAENVITLSKSVALESVPGFEEGLFFVQDESSAMCASLINKASVGKENPIVIDTCACPGGKTFAIAISLENKGEIFSFDLHKNRLSLIESGTKRLGISSVRTDANDARNPKKELFGKADAVLCDVPCSGLGIISKKPDIRFKQYEDIERLPEIQKEILLKSADYVKSGGFIVYSTCTLRKAENEEVIDAFLKEREDFSLSPTDFKNESSGTKTFFPHTDGTDGFFVAKLVKTK